MQRAACNERLNDNVRPLARTEGTAACELYVLAENLAGQANKSPNIRRAVRRRRMISILCGCRNSMTVGFRKLRSARRGSASTCPTSARWRLRPSTHVPVAAGRQEGARPGLRLPRRVGLRGAGDIIEVCQSRIHHEPFHLSKDGNFSWKKSSALAPCVNAPMVLIWKDTL